MTPSECTLLLIDDEPANLDLLEAFLEPDGYGRLVRASDARDAPALFARHAPDVVLLDLHMPFRSGYDVLRDIQESTAPGDFVPVVVLTADVTPAARLRALGQGAHDFLTKPLDAVEVRLRVRNLLRTRTLHVEQRRAREAAEAARAAREFVLSVVAHDLRNPVAAVAMDAEMVRELLPEDAYAAERAALARLTRTAQRMQLLIEDLLEVSRLERGAFALRMRPVPASDWLGDAATMLAPLARARDVQLVFDGAADVPPVEADPARLVQVLSNLVDNAIRFTPAGGHVRVNWRTDGEALRVAVSDDGAGIPAEDLPHVFAPFWQGEQVQRRARGAGLGLVIARAIVEAHGGSIGIESVPGGGTTVAFTVPFAVGHVHEAVS